MNSSGIQKAGRALLSAVVIAAAIAPPAAANGVDGAGRIVIVPLVMKSPSFESLITVTNTGPERLIVSSTLFPSDDTAPTGTFFPCGFLDLEPFGSRSIGLEDLCGRLKSDGTSLGYLELTSRGDATLNFFATSTIANDEGSVVSTVAGQPVGAYEAAWSPGLEVIGLRTDGTGDETLACYVGALDEPKNLTVDLVDAAGNRTLGRKVVKLQPRQMVRLDLRRFYGLSIRPRPNLLVRMLSIGPAPAVVGCGFEERTGAIIYQPAQTLAPINSARLRSVDIGTLLREGPYRIAQVWQHTSAGSALDLKATLSTYLRPNDAVRCRLQTPFGASFDPTPWLELQVKAPDGRVVAGGNGATDTGVFQTGPLGHRSAAAGQRWQIEVSFDEAYHAAWPWPSHEPAGVWSVHCESAGGMSEPIGVDIPGNTDDF